MVGVSLGQETRLHGVTIFVPCVHQKKHVRCNVAPRLQLAMLDQTMEIRELEKPVNTTHQLAAIHPQTISTVQMSMLVDLLTTVLRPLELLQRRRQAPLRAAPLRAEAPLRVEASQLRLLAVHQQLQQEHRLPPPQQLHRQHRQ
jgi:hypothetical protein